VCNAKKESIVEAPAISALQKLAEVGVLGNFNQKQYPVNPITYMTDRGIQSVHRFILTNPDMDHMDGIKAFFKEFPPTNFWDTDNTETKEFGEGSNGGFNEDDWDFYLSLRNSESDPKRLALYSGATGQFYNRGADGSAGGDGLSILAPTPELVDDANESEDFNDCSYVLLYRTGKPKVHRILFGGRHRSSIVFQRGTSPATFRCKHQPSSNW